MLLFYEAARFRLATDVGGNGQIYVRHYFVNNREFLGSECAQAFAEHCSAHTFKAAQKLSVYVSGEISVFRIESADVVRVTLGGCRILKLIFLRIPVAENNCIIFLCKVSFIIDDATKNIKK